VATDIPLDPPAGTAGSALADWLEMLMILRGDEELSREQIRRLLIGEPLEHPSEEQVEEVGVEEMTRYARRIDSLLMEVERRAAVAPRIYPFRVEDQLVSRVAVVGGLAYRFLLWLSLKNAPFRDGRLEEVEEPFDDLSRAALVVLVGPDGDAKLFAQRYAFEDATNELRPEGFPEAIAWLRGHLKLRKGKGSAHQADNEDGESDEGGDGDERAETSTGDEQADDLPLRTYNDGGCRCGGVATLPRRQGRLPGSARTMHRPREMARQDA
jgi:hypothetical protein